MADVKLDLVPWMTPNFASLKMPPGRRPDGFRELPKFALTELEPETLARMCDDFRSATTAWMIWSKVPLSGAPMLSLYKANEIYVARFVEYVENVTGAAKEPK